MQAFVQEQDAVYPRVCGGTQRVVGFGGQLIGLSPRVRGNPSLADYPAVPAGSIPACAGEPDTDAALCKHHQVYPRVCGGTLPNILTISTYVGLSPRVRGNPLGFSWHNQAAGSIPACAGEPPCGIEQACAVPVYPRVCGGTDGITITVEDNYGLSPRVRGNLVGRVVLCFCPGSIPACAGEPSSSSRTAASPAVYPRVCGGTL